MPSLVELVFSALGTQQAAAAVKEVDANLQQLNQHLGVVNVSGAAAQQAIGGMARGAAQTAPAVRSLQERVVDLSASIRSSLTPHLDGVTKQLLTMAAAITSVRMVIAGFRDAISGGADLQRLSLRTGESVRDLVIQEQAFRNAGLGANYLATASNLLDRALSPLNANSKRNVEVFRELGLTMDELRGKNLSEQLTLLSEGFARLPDQAARAEAAMQIFGRYAGGQMLQLLGDPHWLELATEQAGRLGDRMEQDAASFNDVAKSLNIIKVRLKEMWVAAAEQLLPTLRSIASIFGGMNLSGLGTMIGAVGPVAGGGLLSIWGIDRLDMALLNVAERFEGRMTGAIARVASQATGLLATALPFGIAAALAAQIVAGLAQARASAEWQQVLHDISASHNVRTSVATQLGTISSLSGGEAEAQRLRAKLADVERRRAELAKEMARAGAGPRDISQAAAHGSFGVSLFATLAKVAGGAEYTGLNGKPRDFTADQSEALRLQADEETYRQALANISTPAGIAKTAAGNRLAALRQSLAPLLEQLPELRDRHARDVLAGMSPSTRLATLRNRSGALEQQLGHINPGLDAETKEAQRLSLENQIFDLKKQEAEAQKQIDAETKKTAAAEQQRAVYALETRLEQAKAAGNESLAQGLKEQIEQKRASVTLSGKDLELARERISAEHQIWVAQQAQAAAKKEIEGQQKGLEANIRKLRANLAGLDADYTRADAQKWADKRDELVKEVAALQAAAANERALAAAARAPGGAGEQVALLHEAAANGLDLQANHANASAGKLGANPNSVGSQLASQTTALQNSMGTVAQQIGQAWKSLGDTMRNSLASSFYSMLSRAHNFRQAAGALWVSLEQSVGQSVSRMAADYVMQHVVMDNARRLFHALGLTEQKIATTGEVTVHATGEVTKTGATAAGASSRTAIRMTETVIHGMLVAIRTAMHIAGEIAQTAATMAQSALRIAAIIAESLVSIIKAAAGAMAAMASIPYVGPILAIAAAAAMIAEGSSLLKGARATGGPVEAGSAYLVGEERPEVFVPNSDGYIFPDASAFSAPAPRTAGAMSASAARVSSVPSTPSGGFAGGTRSQNLHVYLDYSAYSKAIREDMEGVAHAVYDKRARGA